MPAIVCTCAECGWVELEPSAITLWVCDQPKEASHYRFTCPKCSCLVRKLADDHIIGLLQTSGAQLRKWRPPAEALERHTGAPISYDDLIAFHRMLETM